MAAARSGRACGRPIAGVTRNIGYINCISNNKGGGVADLVALLRRNERSLSFSSFQGNEFCDQKNNVHFLTLALSQKITDLQIPLASSGTIVTPDEYLMGKNHD